jgi:hypothetical protein
VRGTGCTVEGSNGRTISFDLDALAPYQFDPRKFNLYTEEPLLDDFIDAISSL